MKSTLPQIGILIGFWLIGELIVFLTHCAIPSSIIGMVLLTLALQFKLIKLKQVEQSADFLIRNMAFFFIPPGVGLMVNLELIADNWVAITSATILSTILVLVVTALVAQVGRKKE
ncbi:MAG: CidA/LrgA family protein [Flavobacteriaceae bacterium]|nr:CidA/LrgA family protein [Flavobacteriaceae bacterium]